ncbi:hypothetical protein [Nonomuraea insulae]|uniref:Uncharacterized protein n=1 Tax=Nonomuraea insulae TaxID=1616787 RepID=A0ABW1D806_9ACTN
MEVLSLLGDSTPRVRAVGGQKQIVITDLTVDREPLYSVYVLRGAKYEKISYEFCDGHGRRRGARPAVVSGPGLRERGPQPGGFRPGVSRPALTT